MPTLSLYIHIYRQAHMYTPHTQNMLNSCCIMVKAVSGPAWIWIHLLCKWPCNLFLASNYFGMQFGKVWGFVCLHISFMSSGDPESGPQKAMLKVSQPMNYFNFSNTMKRENGSVNQLNPIKNPWQLACVCIYSEIILDIIKSTSVLWGPKIRKCLFREMEKACGQLNREVGVSLVPSSVLLLLKRMCSLVWSMSWGCHEVAP